MMPKTIRHACMIILTATACASAQRIDGPPRGLPPAANPDRIILPDVLEWKPGKDPQQPDHSLPPMAIKDIPPMPMPVPGGPMPATPLDDSVTIYDATTGTARTLPLGKDLPPDWGARAPYGGVGDVVLEPQAWSGIMTSVTNAAMRTYPASANVKLLMEFTDQCGALQYFTCSGTMADPGVVLTAAHCVYDRQPRSCPIFNWANRVWVIPAWDGAGDNEGNGPAGTEILENFGWAVGYRLLAGTAFVESSDWRADVGAVFLDRTTTRSVGMLSGWFLMQADACNTSTTLSNYSYPAQACSSTLHDGRTMRLWQGVPDGCSDNLFRLDTTPGCFTAVCGDMSGSSLFETIGGWPYAKAVASTSDRSTVAYYCSIWPQMLTDIALEAYHTRGTVLDVEPLRVRAGTTIPSVQSGSSLTGASVIIANPTNADPGPTTYTLTVRLSGDELISAADTLLATLEYTQDLAPGANAVWNLPALAIPRNTPTSEHYVGVILDSSVDANPANNSTQLWDAMKIAVLPCTKPSNDECPWASIINDPGAPVFSQDTAQDTWCATQSRCDAIDGCGADVNGASVWHSFTPSHDGVINLDTFGSDYDTVLSVHLGCPAGSATSCTRPPVVACNDDTVGSLQSAIVALPVVTGTTYLIRSAAYGTSAAGRLHLHFDFVATSPANDACADATVITGDSFTETVDVINATRQACEHEASCVVEPWLNHSVWYAFTPPSAGKVSVDTMGSAFDTVLSIFNQCADGSSLPVPICLPAASLACNDDWGTGLQSAIFDFPVDQGQPLRFKVASYASFIEFSDMTFSFRFQPDPDTPCRADFNEDGGVDFEDVSFFYWSWEAGDTFADINLDGGTDGTDVLEFFRVWEAGGC